MVFTEKYIKIKMKKYNSIQTFIKNGLQKEFCPEPSYKDK